MKSTGTPFVDGYLIGSAVLITVLVLAALAVAIF